MSDQSSVVPASNNLPVGLEDFSMTDDSRIPVVSIDHKEATFVDGLTGVVYPSLEGIVMLGQIKQRVLWPAQMSEEKKPPLCRSYDSKTGFPGEEFPWEASGFTAETVTQDDEGNYLLSCDLCNLKEWNTHPIREIPWCSMQHVYAILINDSGVWVPSIFTAQRSGLKPSNTYAAGFARSQSSMFTVYTSIELESRHRGSNNFAVPKFKRVGETATEEHQFFIEQYYSIRDYVQTPRGLDAAAGVETPVAAPVPSGPPTAPAPAPTPPPAAAPPAAPAPAPPAAMATPAEASAVDDLPF